MIKKENNTNQTAYCHHNTIKDEFAIQVTPIVIAYNEPLNKTLQTDILSN